MADPALSAVISTIESGNDSQAIRFEPGVYAWPTDVYDRAAIISKISAIHHCTRTTAHVLFSSSFGHFQLMGFNLYGPKLNLDTTVFDYCADQGAQLDTFQKFLISEVIDYTLADLLADPAKMTHFCTTWNGPGAVEEYAALIRKYAT